MKALTLICISLLLCMRFMPSPNGALYVAQAAAPASRLDTFRGSTHRALGRWYQAMPAALGGSTKKAEDHLRRALAHTPGHMLTLYLLGETLIDQDRLVDARATLQTIVDAPPVSVALPEDSKFKAKARTKLEELANCPTNCLCRSTHGPGAMCLYR